MQELSANDVNTFHRISWICAGLGLAIALMALVGWVVGIPPLMHRMTPGPNMNPVVAVLLALSSISLGLQLDPTAPPPRRALGRALGGVVGLVALIRLSDLYLGTQSHVDLWLFPSKVAVAAPYEHAALSTAWCLLLLAGALMLFDTPGPRGTRWRELFALAASLVVFDVLLVYAFAVTFLITAPARTMALITAVGLLTIVLGLLCARPGQGLMRHVSSPSPGGQLLRRLLPVLMLLPPLVALAYRVGRKLSPQAFVSEVVFSQIALVGLSIAFAWWLGATLNREDERRRAYGQALAEREAITRRALSRTFDMVAIVQDHRLVYVNEAFVRSIGAQDAAELIGTHFLHYVDPSDRRLEDQRYEAVLEGRDLPAIEKVAVRVDGRPLDIECIMLRITHHGRPAAQIVARDISARKAMEQALTESNLRYQTVFGGAVFAILMLDLAGNVSEGNRAAERLLGRSLEALLGVPLSSLLYRDDVVAVMAEFWKMLSRNQDSFVTEARLAVNDGAVWARLSGFYIPHGAAEIPTIMLMLADVTARHQLEVHLRAQNEQLQQMERMRTDVINAVTHDLRSPLTAIIGYGEMLADQLAGPLNAQQQEFLQVQQRNARRLEGMIEDMLDYVRLEAGTFALQFGPTNFNKLVENVIKTFMPTAIQAGIRLEAHLPGEPVVGEVDADRIERVLANLVSNALKFTPAGGSVTVTVSMRDEHIRCLVTDTGMGIAEADLSKLFQRFSQLATGTRHPKSTGIGLYISRALVEAHHGTIGVTSEEAHGSEFWFELPIAPLKGVPEQAVENEATHEEGGARDS